MRQPWPVHGCLWEQQNRCCHYHHYSGCDRPRVNRADYGTADHGTADYGTADHDVRPCRGLLLARRCNWSDGERDRHDLQNMTYRQPRSLAIAVARVPHPAIAPPLQVVRATLLAADRTGVHTPSDQGFLGGPYRTRTCDPLRVMHILTIQGRPLEVTADTSPGHIVQSGSEPFISICRRCCHRCCNSQSAQLTFFRDNVHSIYRRSVDQRRIFCWGVRLPYPEEHMGAHDEGAVA